MTDKMQIEHASIDDGESLAELRLLAMQESLEAAGRFCPARARERFLSTFKPRDTRKIIVNTMLAGFYVRVDYPDNLHLDHLYVHPKHQGGKIGSSVIKKIILTGQQSGKVIRLGALKGSRSNGFYLSHGFVKTHEEEFDNFYEYTYS